MDRDLVSVLARIRARIPDATPRELAELLWLSAQLGPPAHDPPPDDTPPPSDILVQPPAQHPRNTREQGDAALSIDDAEKDHSAAQPSASSSPSPLARRLRGRLARPAALTELLSWSRALHRLGTLAAAGPLEVDRLATVQLAAKLGEIHLVRRLRDLPVTWLAIVEDSAGQLAPWQRSNAALAVLARRSGRFARVCHLRVDLSDPQTATLAAPDTPPANPGAHAKDPTTALHHALAGAGHPGQPLLVLVITDGLAPGLRSGALTRALTHLPAAASVAWMHPWGESRWSASPLLATLARGRPCPLQPHDRRPLRPALIPWSPSGLATLEAWAAGRTTADLPGVHFSAPRPRHAQPRHSPPAAASPPSDINWDDRGRKLACSLEPGTQQLLALTAGVPGAVNLDLLQAFAERTSERPALTTVPISRFNFAEALASGLLERDKTRPGLVVRFRDDDKPGAPARSVALRWLDTQQATDLLQFLAARLTAGDPRSDGLGIPYALLLHILDPKANALDADLDLTPAQRGSLRSVIELARLDIPATTRAALELSRPPPVSRPNIPSEDRIHTLVIPWLKRNIEALGADLQPDLEALPLRVGQPPTEVTDLAVMGITIDHEALDQPLRMGPHQGSDSTVSVTFTRNAGITLRRQGDRLHAGVLLWGTARLRGHFSGSHRGEDTLSAGPRYRGIFAIEWRASFDLDITTEPASCTLRGHTNLSVSPYHFTHDELNSINDIEPDERRPFFDDQPLSSEPSEPTAPPESTEPPRPDAHHPSDARPASPERDFDGRPIGGPNGAHVRSGYSPMNANNAETQQVVLLLDLATENPIFEDEVLDLMPQSPHRRVLRISNFGAQPTRRGQQWTEWSTWARAVDAMIAEAQAGQSPGRAPHYYVAGRASLPVFAYLGLQRGTQGTLTVLNQRDSGRWDLIPTDPAERSADLRFFGEPEVLPGDSPEGDVAVFLSTGYPTPEDAIAEYLERHGKKRAATVVLGTEPGAHWLSAETAGVAAGQVRDLLADLRRYAPKARGVALFLAGPASLAIMAGRFLNPHMFRSIRIPAFDANNYRDAIQWSPEAVHGGTLRILLLTTSPADIPSIHLAAEERAIRRLLAGVTRRGVVKLDVIHSAMAQNILVSMINYRPHVLHIAAPGDHDEFIISGGGHGDREPVPLRELLAAIKMAAGDLQLLVLNACYSASATSELSNHVDYTIGIRNAVADESSMIYSEGFYAALSYGRSLMEAHEQGLAQLKIVGLPNDDIELLVRPGCDAGQWIPLPGAAPLDT